jgi:succinate dehydrogenase / fumarate reductase cytochrome b subunit
MLNGLKTTLTDGVRYRGGSQHWLWMGHRLSGLAIMFFLITHVIGMSLSFFSPAAHDQMLAVYKTLPFELGTLALAAALVFHSVNGTRIALMELKPAWWSQQKKASQLTWALTVLIGAPVILSMAAILFQHFVLGKK